MIAALSAALLLVGLVGFWLAWRYIRLVRAIRDFRSSVRENPVVAAASVNELVALGSTVREVAGATAAELSSVISERDRLNAVLDQLTDGVLIADSGGEIRYSNPAASQLFQTARPIGRSVTQVLRDHRLVEAWQRARRLGELQSETAEIPIRQQFLQLIVIPDAHAAGTLLLAQDLTRIRRLETVRQDFVSNFSHELRTPLASLKALAETLEDGALRDPEAGPRFLKRIVAEVDTLSQMAQELLELSGIESGQARLQLERLHPRQLLESAAERMRAQADRASVALQVECPEELPEIRGDPARLGQVLVNLIHNAIKFTAPGGRIVLSVLAVGEGQQAGTFTRASTAAVQFSVSDSGSGIAAEDLPRIFERFYRADKARTRGSTGLGLSIAKHIVEAHGGRIWAESVQGRGSTFSFVIPQLRPGYAGSA